MTISAALIWFLAGVLFLMGELTTTAFVLIFFAAGCWLTALVVRVADIPFAGQIALFIISSLVLLFTLRKYSLRTFRGDAKEGEDDTFATALIGKRGVVTKRIAPPKSGEVRAAGSFWRATAEEVIEAGQPVKVDHQVPGDLLVFMVKPIKESSHE